ncbi:MAG: PhnD/SsuA/transferrin family substrate-binding protein [Anaerolineae bacterium]|nr:PhnD/SsuA/transferrin family substrate-binding protein [Anaerolineae bacterium]
MDDMFRKTHTTVGRILLLILTITALAACRREVVEEVAPAALPTASATPRSTPLPPLPGSVALGDPANPIQIAVVPADPDLPSDAAENLEADLLTRTAYTIRIVTVDSEAEAIQQMCDSFSGPVTAAWLSGIGYWTASARNCGQPLLWIVRGSGSNAASGETVVIVARQGGAVTSLSALRDRNFCRISSADLTSWIVPSLMLGASDVDVVRDLKSVRDYPDNAALLAAVADGGCDAAAVPTAALEEADSADRERLIELATSESIPYLLLVVPIQVTLGVRDTLSAALLDIAADRQTATLLRPFLGQTRLQSVASDDLTAFETFVTRSGLDFSQLGR